MTLTHHETVATVCGNCDAPLHGAFCHACGQRAAGPAVGLHDFAHEARAAVLRVAPVGTMVPWVIVADHFLALRRVFGGSRLEAAWKGALIWGVYTILLVATMLAIGLRSLGAGAAQH